MIKQEILDKFKNKKCCVTGATGLIGRQVVELLIEAGADVLARPSDDCLV